MRDHKSDQLNFIFIGPQRTGTSWLDRYLRVSENLQLPSKVKETYFFNRKYSKGLKYLFSLFDRSDIDKKGILFGEIAPTYFTSEVARKKIFSHNKDCKIIVIHRDPVDKAISLFKHHLSKGRVKKDIKSAVAKYPEIIESGKYHKWISRWKDQFGIENLLVIDFNELQNNQQTVIDKVCIFLKINTIHLQPEWKKKYNSSTVPISPLIANIFSRGASVLRKYDMHLIANFGKKIGLKNAYHGSKKNIIISSEERKWLGSYFSNEDFNKEF